MKNFIIVAIVIILVVIGVIWMKDNDATEMTEGTDVATTTVEETTTGTSTEEAATSDEVMTQ